MGESREAARGRYELWIEELKKLNPQDDVVVTGQYQESTHNINVKSFLARLENPELVSGVYLRWRPVRYYAFGKKETGENREQM